MNDIEEERSRWETGARVFRRIDDVGEGQLLLQDQRTILKRIFISVREIAESEMRVEAEADTPDDYVAGQFFRRPSNVFLIDGARGSGKTTMLLTVRLFLAHFGRSDPNTLLKEPVWDHKIHKYIETDSKSWGPSFNHGFVKPHENPKTGVKRATAHILPLWIPQYVATNDKSMEGFLSFMSTNLKTARETLEAGTEYGSDARLQQVKRLQETLDRTIIPSWSFAQDIGRDALLSDSINFDDYIQNYLRQTQITYERSEIWRQFVNHYLDFFGAELLSIFIDDTDVATEQTYDAMATIRVFLDHPRIVTFVAGNLDSMRLSLVQRYMSERSQSIVSLRNTESYYATHWRHNARYQVEEFLEKVLPRNFRNFIRPLAQDFKSVFGGAFEDKTWDLMQSALPEFKRSRCRQAWEEQSLEEMDSNRGNETRHGVVRDAENYVAWWLLRVFYQDNLLPNSARHLVQLRSQLFHPVKSHNSIGANADREMSGERNVESVDDQEKEQAEEKLRKLFAYRRVPVIFFQSPRNHLLTHRFRDRDADVLEWLRKQELNTYWRGVKTIQIDSLKLQEGTYSFDFLLYRLDIGLALPQTLTGDHRFPRRLLPKTSGNVVSVPEVWELKGGLSNEMAGRLNCMKLHHEKSSEGNGGFLEALNIANKYTPVQELHGVARAFENPIIPANCVYFKDLKALPEIVWEWQPDDEDMPDPGTRKWPFYPIAASEDIFNFYPKDARRAYFQKVVLVFGSYPLLPALPPDEFEIDPDEFQLEDGSAQLGLIDFELNNVADKNLEKIETGPFFENFREVVGTKIRALAPAALYDQDFAPSGQHRIFDVRAIAKALPGEKDGKTKKAKEAASATIISRVIPRYHRILQDVRRSWHATKLFDNDVAHCAVDSGNEYELDQRVIPGRDDRYHLVGIAEISNAIDAAIDCAATGSIGRHPRIKADLISKKNGLHQVLVDALGKNFGEFSVLNGSVEEKDTNEQLKDIVNRMEHAGIPARLEEIDNREKEHKSKLDKEKASLGLFWRLDRHEKFLKTKFELEFPAKVGADRWCKDTASVIAKEFHRAQIFRSIMFYLWGLGPTLSSLIHVDVVGHHFSEDTDKVERIKEWRAFLTDASWFVYLLGWLLRDILVFKDRATFEDEINSMKTEARSDKGFAICPDISIKTLGLPYRNRDADSDNLAHPPLPTEFSGIIGDILLRLSVARAYLDGLSDKLGVIIEEKPPSE